MIKKLKSFFGICNCGGFVYKKENISMVVLECDKCGFGEISPKVPEF